VPHDEETRGFQEINVSKAVARGLRFRPLADTARATLDFARSRPPTHKMQAGLAPEKEAAVLKAWHEKRPTTTPIK
jgi:2'-hydroxyisoflavone reductase